MVQEEQRPEEMPQENYDMPSEGTMSPFAKIIGVIIDPERVVKSISNKPDWLIPLAVLLLGVFIFIIAAGDVLTQFALDNMMNSFEQQVERGGMSETQAEQIFNQQKGMIGYWIYGQTFFMTVVQRLLGALGLLFIGNILFGGDKKFKHYWSLVLYGGIIAALGSIISGILVNISGDMFGAQLGLGILTNSNPDTTLHKIASAINFFAIWEATVLGLGISVFTNSTRAKGIMTLLFITLGLNIGFSLMTGFPMM
ncbi:YIP1 family protein [bacterium]|nr:YIP1 family protein [bacterium]